MRQEHPPLRLLAMMIALCLADAAQANPSGSTVVNGSASVDANGRTLTVTNSPGAIINWQQFSIRPDEVTRFIQSGAASTVLNRVTGTQSSSLLGQLLSNGRVFLINPNGVAIGAGAYIDTAGFVASSLPLSNEDFLAGRMRFGGAGGPAVGNVVNQGRIHTQAGGPVYLIAPNVENSGVITAPNGEILLAAGKSVELVSGAAPQLRVLLSAPEGGEAVNVGQLVAQAGSVGIFGALVRNGGLASANSASVNGRGNVVLKATGDVFVEPTGRVEAINTAGTGGTVAVLGDRVGVLSGAGIDASGQTGGGSVLIGGDLRGGNAQVPNARSTVIASGASIRADATQQGQGGRVIAWSDDYTGFHGAISARGGAMGGDGGFVETSGKNNLQAFGTVDAGSPLGAAGQWLLDPRNVTIANATSGGAFSAANPSVFTPTADNAVVDAGTINASLNAATSVNITTGTTGTQAGNITVAAPISKTAGGNATFRLLAANGIVFNPGTSVTSTSNQLNLTLTAPGGITGLPVTNLNGGAFVANNPVTLTANTTMNAGNITFGTVDSDTTPRALTLNAAGATTFNGAVGRTSPLASLTTDAPGLTTFNAGSATIASVTTAGAQTYNDAVALGAVLSADPRAFTSTGAGNITFASTVDSSGGAARLIVNTAGVTRFGGAIGTAARLNSISTDDPGTTRIGSPSVLTTAGQSYNDAVVLTGDAAFRASNANQNITFVKQLDSDGTPRNAIVDATGTKSFQGGVGQSSPLASLTTTGAGNVRVLGGGVTTTGAQTYGSIVRLNIAPDNTLFTSTNGGNMTFGGGVDSENPAQLRGFGAFTDGTVFLNGPMGATIGLFGIFTTGPTVLAGGTLRARDFIQFEQPVTLAADTTMTVTGPQLTFPTPAVVFANSIDSAPGTSRALTINSFRETLLFGPIGGTTPLGSLSISSPAGTQFAGGPIRTTGAQAYSGPFQLLAPTTMTSTAGGNVTLASAAGGGNDLTINTAGLTTLTNALGLSRLTTDAPGTVALNGPIDAPVMSINEANGSICGSLGGGSGNGSFSIAGAVVLCGNTTINAGSIAFGSTVDSSTGNVFSLTANAAGPFSSGPLGGSAALGGLSVNAGGISLNGNARTAIGASPLAGNVTLASTGALAVNGTLDTSAANGGITLSAAAGPIGSDGAPVGVNAGSGVASASTSAPDGNIFLNSAGPLSLGALVTNGASQQTVRVRSTGPVTVLDRAEGIAGDLTEINAGANTLTVQDTAFDAGNGVLHLIGDEVNLLGGAGSIRGSGDVYLEPYTLATAVNVRGPDTGLAGTLDLSATDLDALRDGFASITIGNGAGTGHITINAATFNDSVWFRSFDPSSAGISVAGPLNAGTNTITFNTTGTATQTAPIAAAGIELLGTGGIHTLTNPGNSIGTIAANTGSVTYTPAGNAVVGIVNGSVGITTTSTITISAGGNVVLNQPVSAGAAGNAAVLSGANFINSAGASAIATPNGRWIVYSTDPAADTFGGLASNSAPVWGASLASRPLTNIPAGNRYVFIAPQTLTFTSTDTTKIYGDDASDVIGSSFAVTGFNTNTFGGAFLADTAATTFTGAPAVTSIGSAPPATVAGGPYGIAIATGSLAATNGYAFSFDPAGRLGVTPRSLAVTADPQTKVYGSADPTLTYSAPGLVNGDTLFGSVVRVAGETVLGGPYAITQGTLANPNYTLAFTNGQLTIAPRALAVAADPQTKIYGAADPALTVSAPGLVNGDTLAGSAVRSPGETVPGGPYAITQGTLANPNYAISFTNGQFAITPRPISVVATDGVKLVGTPDPRLSYSVSGLVGGDTLNGNLARAAGENAAGGPYAITQGTLTDTNNPNYHIGFTGARFTILEAPVAIAPSVVEPPPAIVRSVIEPSQVLAASALGSASQAALARSDVSGSDATPPGASVPTLNLCHLDFGAATQRRELMELDLALYRAARAGRELGMGLCAGGTQ
ncbi:MBG domain-containing protein [Variovorax sp. J2P1-59]|uniref:MBG domain-containing protein n=1 Tax=Variovorax flavidus TaxID=3053501 RepID=UPI002576E068|nr:MBG domain-containing protein [Variovorax sp. J2P1-59]MDM0074834.1 MBG domain-containing protein [Variovorax sp. J2P1-59]